MRSILLVLPLLFCLGACTKNEFGPISTPAAEHPAYARAYPEELTNSLKLYEIEHAVAKDFPAKLSLYLSALKNPSYLHVGQIYKLAEADGKSASYAHIKRENTAIAVFFVDEKKDIVKKVSGGVHYQAKQDKCDSQFYGTIDRGLENGVVESFEKRQDEQSQAQLYIKQYEENLGKENVKPLTEQANSIAAASYLVNILLAEHHQQLQAQVAEAKRVEKTLSARLDELEGARNSGESDKERDARNAEQSALFTARVELETTVKNAKKRLETSEQDITFARDAFNKAMTQLLSDVDKKAAGTAPTK